MWPATGKGTIRCRMTMQRKWPNFTAKSAFMESATSPVWESIIIYLPFGKSRVSLRPSWRALWRLCRRSFPVRSTAHGHFTVKFRRGLRSIWLARAAVNAYTETCEWTGSWSLTCNISVQVTRGGPCKFACSSGTGHATEKPIAPVRRASV